MSYMVARYYKGSVGRFNSVDPVYNDLGYGVEKYGLSLYDILSNPQELNSGRTTDKLNSISEFNWRKNTPLKNNLTFTQVEYLANPQRLNSYSYCRNNPLIYTDPLGETEFHFSITTNVGLGGGAGNTWSFGIATDGTYGSSVSYHWGGLAGYDASVGVALGYSNAETWSDTQGDSYYTGMGGRVVLGGDINVSLSEGGAYEGLDVGAGVGPPPLIIFMGAGKENTTILTQGNIKNDISNAWQAVKQTATNIGQTVAQSASNVYNKINRFKND